MCIIICSNMENKTSLQRRQQLQKDGVPTYAEVYRQIGPELASHLLKSFHAEEKILGQMIPQVVESDCEECEKKRKWQHFSIENRKTITHRAITNLGEQYVSHYEKQFEEDKQNAVNVEVDRTIYEAELKCCERVESVLKAERKIFERQTAASLHFFTLALQGLGSKIQEEMRRAANKEIGKERTELAALLEDKIKFAKEKMSKEMQAKFQAQEREHAEDMTRMLTAERLKLTHHKYDMLKDSEERHTEAIEILRNQLETKQFSEISDVIKTEQQKCLSKVHEVTKWFEEQNAELNTTIKQNEIKITELQKHVTEARDQISLWERKTELILQEFQKFINYVHDVVGEQADHMLSIDRLNKEDVHMILSSFLPKTDVKQTQDDTLAECMVRDAAIQTSEQITVEKSVMAEILEDAKVAVASTDASTQYSTETHLEDEPAETVRDIEQYFLQEQTKSDETSAVKTEFIRTHDIDIGEIYINLSDEVDMISTGKIKARETFKSELTKTRKEKYEYFGVDDEKSYEENDYFTSETLKTEVPGTYDVLESNDGLQKLLDSEAAERREGHKSSEKYITKKDDHETHHTYVTDVLMESFNQALTKKEQDSETHKRVQDILQELKQHPSLMYMIIS